MKVIVKHLFISLFLFSAQLLWSQVEFEQSACLVQDTTVFPAIEALHEVKTQRYADFDNDGDADLIVYGKKNGSIGPQSMVWFLENQGGFEMILKPDSINLGMSFPPLISDLDQDGDLDVIITKGIYNYTTLFFQNVALINQGGFSFVQVPLPALDTIEVEKWHIMDANGDDFPDILVNGKKNGVAQGHTYIFLNDTLGHFNTPGINLGVMKTVGIAIIDKNHDGFDDIIFSGTDASLSKLNKFFLNQGNNTFSESTFTTPWTLYNPQVYVHDFDSDGHDDFVICKKDGGGPHYQLFLNNYPQAGFTQNSTILPMGSQFYNFHNQIFVDLDSDGSVEIVTFMSNSSLTSSNGVRKLFIKGPTGVYAEDTTIVLGDIWPYQEYDTIDIDNNGFIDVYHVKYHVQQPFKRLETYFNESGFFTFPRQFRFFDESRICDVLDVNQDGFDDFLAVSPFNANASGVYINNAGQGFSRLDIPMLNNPGILWFEAIDIDGDGDMDFVGNRNQALPNPNGLFVIKNDGGTYIQQTLPFAISVSQLFVMNFDNMHQKDLLIINGTTLSIYVTDANGNLSQVAVSGAPTSFGGLTVGDHNLDGLDDIYSGSAGNIFINNGNNSFSKKINWSSSKASGGKSFLIDVVGDSLLDVVSGQFLGAFDPFGILDYNGVVNQSVLNYYYSDPDLLQMRSLDVGYRSQDSIFHGAYYSDAGSLKGLGYFFKLPNNDFVSSMVFPLVFNSTDVHFIDFDGDGNEDILVQGNLPGLFPHGRIFKNESSCYLSVTQDSVTACQGNIYTWIDGSNYLNDTSGVYFVGIDSSNCFYAVELVLSHLSGNVSLLDSTTVESLDNDAFYQWLDCSNGFQPIPGANGQTFTATTPGLYAVEVSRGSCVDTSDCIPVTLVALDETLSFVCKVFPNPTTGFVSLEIPLGKVLNRTAIFNSFGQMVLTVEPNEVNHFQFDIAHLPAGTYILVFEGNGWSQKEMLIKF